MFFGGQSKSKGRVATGASGWRVLTIEGTGKSGIVTLIHASIGGYADLYQRHIRWDGLDWLDGVFSKSCAVIGDASRVMSGNVSWNAQGIDLVLRNSPLEICGVEYYNGYADYKYDSDDGKYHYSFRMTGTSRDSGNAGSNGRVGFRPVVVLNSGIHTSGYDKQNDGWGHLRLGTRPSGLVRVVMINFGELS